MGQKLERDEQELPWTAFQEPDFDAATLRQAALARFAAAPADGVAPEGFHTTSNFPEFIHLSQGRWALLPKSRMDCMVVKRLDSLEVVEARRLRKGDQVLLGRSEDGQEGVLLHPYGFETPEALPDKFIFRTRGTRETPFSASYDWLYRLLRYEREHGFIAWVGGPALAFDSDSRQSLRSLIQHGFCHALLAGNALATHDLEAGHFGTGLGQDIYDRTLHAGGHYHHLDMINAVRPAGSIQSYLAEVPQKQPGIMSALIEQEIPFVLAGSIRDDGPLPEVMADVYQAQDAMRVHARQATTVIALATQLHSIAFANQLPGYRILPDGQVRPVYLVVVDITEFSVDKLANRGSGQAHAFLTNAQDFLTHLRRNLIEAQ